MAIERMTVVGIELSEGVSKKSGNAYSIGTLYTTTQLAPPLGEGNIAKGSMGDKYACPAELIRKIAHLPMPLTLEAEVQSFMRFGERQQQIVDLRPMDVVKKAA